MFKKIRPAFALLPVLLLAGLPARTGEPAGDPPEAPHKAVWVSAEAAKKLEEELKTKRAELERKRKAEVERFTKEQQDKDEAAKAPRTINVKIGGETIPVKEPRSLEDVPAIERKPFRSWSLRAEDFVFDLPVEIFVPRMVGPRSLIGKDKVFLVLPFSITNTLIEVKTYQKTDDDKQGELLGIACVNSDAELAKLKAKAKEDNNLIVAAPSTAALSPRFTMVTDKGVFTPEASGFLAREAVEWSTYKHRHWTKELISFVRGSKAVGQFKPGESRSGAAVFPRFDPETTRVRILVDGLAAAYKFKKDLRKVMILEFVRPGNVYYPGQVKLRFKRWIGDKLMDPKSGYVPKRGDDVHHGFDWVWLWNWAAAASISVPKSTTDVASPIGKDKFNFWSYRVKLPNRTGQEQPLSVDRVATIVKVKLDVAGKEREIEVPLVDDGKMNVYKAAYFESEGMAVRTDRFPKEAKIESGEDRAAEFTVAFRERDVDFGAVLRNLHNSLDLELALKRNKDGGKRKGKGPYEGTRQLSVKEVASVRDQLAKKLPAALKAQLAKNVVAQITVRSGLASGARTVNYSLYKPAPLPAPPVEE